ncbi:N-acetyltransferase, partial [Rhizoctonia solani]
MYSSLMTQATLESVNVSDLRVKRVASPFTPEEILEYLAFIQWTPLPTLPEPATPQNWPELQPTLGNLEALARAHLLAFPYENTEKHYTSYKEQCFRPRDIFERLIRAGRGLGNTCVGHNTFFKGILQGLGYLTAARINTTWQTSLGPPKFCAMGHMVNIVLPIDAPLSLFPDTMPVPHLVDVGYGGLGALSMLLRPLPLLDGTVIPSFSPPEEHRLVRVPRPQNESTLECEPGWSLQVRASPSEQWRTPHWFTLSEYTESDWEWMSFCISKLPTGPTYNTLMCIKLHELPSGEIARTSIAGQRAVRKVGTQREVLERWEWEEERIEAMARLCGVQLDMAQALEAVRGKPGMALPIREDTEVKRGGEEK